MRLPEENINNGNIIRRSVAGSYDIREDDITPSSRPALVMPPGEKAALFYHRLDEAYGVVADLLKDSVRQNEMCAFVFRSPLEVLKDNMKARGLDVDAHPSIVLVPLSKAPIDSYSQGSIGNQMRTLVQQAKGLGYSGARLILNVPEELSAQVPSESTWLELDKVREELGLTVICLYDMTVLSPSFLLRTLSSYPKVIMDGDLCRNFYYVPSLTSPQRDAFRDLDEQLESIRAERDLRQSEGRERSKLMEINLELQEEMLQRRMVEFALLQAENNLRTMLDAMPEIVLMVDRDLRVTMGNLKLVRYLEATGADTSYEGRWVFDLFPEAPANGRKLFEEVFRLGHPTVIDSFMKVTAGRLDLEVRLVPIKMGDKVDRVVVIARPKEVRTDLMAEMCVRADSLRDMLLDPEGRASGSIETCPHPVLVTGRDGDLRQVNSALCRELERSREEVMAMGSAYGFLSPQKGEGGAIRRMNIDGRILIPSILSYKDGSMRAVMCYVLYVGEGDDADVLTVMTLEH